MLRPSKPCVYELTGKQVECRFCGSGKARVAVVKGWVPLYRRTDGTAICVPVDEVQRDHLDALPTFTKVTVGRERGKGVGVWVRSCTSQEPAWSSSLPEYSAPADISTSLINMWALEEVHQFFACRSDNALSLDAERPAEIAREKPADAHKPDAQPYTAPDPSAKNDAFVAAHNRIAGRVKLYGETPSSNGKPKGEG